MEEGEKGIADYEEVIGKDKSPLSIKKSEVDGQGRAKVERGYRDLGATVGQIRKTFDLIGERKKAVELSGEATTCVADDDGSGYEARTDAIGGDHKERAALAMQKMGVAKFKCRSKFKGPTQ